MVQCGGVEREIQRYSSGSAHFPLQGKVLELRPPKFE